MHTMHNDWFCNIRMSEAETPASLESEHVHSQKRPNPASSRGGQELRDPIMSNGKEPQTCREKGEGETREEELTYFSVPYLYAENNTVNQPEY